MPFSRPDPTLRSVPAPAVPTIVPTAAAMPSFSSTPTSTSASSPSSSEDDDHSPTAAFIPIMHRRVPTPPPPVITTTAIITTTTGTGTAAVPRMPPTPDSDDDDDGFTPITPGSASTATTAIAADLRSPRGGATRAFDALGIPVVTAVGRGILARARSRKVTIVDPSRGGGGGDDDEFEDVETPLTPYHARGMDLEKGDGGGNGNGSRNKRTAATTARRTLFGIIEGWWDLGLLERGRSLRRKGVV